MCRPRSLRRAPVFAQQRVLDRPVQGHPSGVWRVRHGSAGRGPMPRHHIAVHPSARQLRHLHRRCGRNRQGWTCVNAVVRRDGEGASPLTQTPRGRPVVRVMRQVKPDTFALRLRARSMPMSRRRGRDRQAVARHSGSSERGEDHACRYQANCAHNCSLMARSSLVSGRRMNGQGMSVQRKSLGTRLTAASHLEVGSLARARRHSARHTSGQAELLVIRRALSDQAVEARMRLQM